MNDTLKNTTEPRVEFDMFDPRYPEGLIHMQQPPHRLYVIGSVQVLATPALAIVGARKATPYGLSCARRFARAAALRGITIVSGGAVGCDQAAHQGALDVGGTTLVVLGCGADVIYPARAEALFNQVLEAKGALVSEAPWGSTPTKWGFKKRNRIIAGLAQATLIVEAGLPSGTFSTADATLAQGKEVLAVPGSIYAKESKGANRLIAQGAIPIIDDDSFKDALQMLFDLPNIPHPEATKTADNQASATEAGLKGKVLAALSQEPQRAEALQGICGDNVVEVIRYLSTLELAGHVEKLRDGRYSVAYG